MYAARSLSEIATLMQGAIASAYLGRLFASKSLHCCGVNFWPTLTSPASLVWPKQYVIGRPVPMVSTWAVVHSPSHGLMNATASRIAPAPAVPTFLTVDI